MENPNWNEKKAFENEAYSIFYKSDDDILSLSDARAAVKECIYMAKEVEMIIRGYAKWYRDINGKIYLNKWDFYNYINAIY